MILLNNHPCVLLKSYIYQPCTLLYSGDDMLLQVDAQVFGSNEQWSSDDLAINTCKIVIKHF